MVALGCACIYTWMLYTKAHMPKLFRWLYGLKVALFVCYMFLEIQWVNQRLGVELEKATELSYSDIQWSVFEAALFLTMVASDYLYQKRIKRLLHRFKTNATTTM